MLLLVGNEALTTSALALAIARFVSAGRMDLLSVIPLEEVLAWLLIWPVFEGTVFIILLLHAAVSDFAFGAAFASIMPDKVRMVTYARLREVGPVLSLISAHLRIITLSRNDIVLGATHVTNYFPWV